MYKFEQRAGPEARKLFERFLRQLPIKKMRETRFSGKNVGSCSTKAINFVSQPFAIYSCRSMAGSPITQAVKLALSQIVFVVARHRQVCGQVHSKKLVCGSASTEPER